MSAPIPAINIPAALAADLGHRLMAECSTVSGFIILPTGGYFGGRAYRPQQGVDAARIGAAFIRGKLAKMKPGGEAATFLRWSLESPACEPPADPVHEAARALLDAFGGDVPAWLAAEWDALAKALDAITIKGPARSGDVN